MKNIGIFTHDLYPFKPWGQGRYVHDLVKSLRKNYDGKIYVFSPSDNVNDELHIQIFRGSHNALGKNINFSIKLGLEIETIIKKNYLSLAHFQGGPGGLFLLKKCSVPVIYTIHHTYYQQARYIPSQKWKKLLFLWEKYSYRRSDYLICDSPSTEKIILKEYKVNPKHCKTIPIGVNREVFYPLKLEKLPKSILFLGRLERRKGIDFLIKAIPFVKAAIDDVQVYIGGDGVLKQYLEHYIKENRLIQSVHLLGTIDDSELHAWYNRVSIVVIPSVFEGFGLTAVEAMACGTPVIATDVDALRDIVEDGVNGFLVKYNDVLDLGKKIIYLLENRDEQERLSENGIKQATTLYDWGILSEEVTKIYDYLQ